MSSTWTTSHSYQIFYRLAWFVHRKFVLRSGRNRWSHHLRPCHFEEQDTSLPLHLRQWATSTSFSLCLSLLNLFSSCCCWYPVWSLSHANITRVAIFVFGMKAKQHMDPLHFHTNTTFSKKKKIRHRLQSTTFRHNSILNIPTSQWQCKTF